VARHDDQPAVEGGQPWPDDAIGENAPGDGQQVDGRAVDGKDDLAGVLAQPQAAVADGVDDEVQQDGSHPVVGEALPHLHVEHPGQAPGVAEQPAVLARRGCSQGVGAPPAGDHASGDDDVALDVSWRRWHSSSPFLWGGTASNRTVGA